MKNNIPYKTVLPPAFFQRSDVVTIARELLGKVLVTELEGVRTAGKIVETEAYRAPDDKACHAWNNRRTRRTEVMFQPGGHAYIYLCYGIHHLFNVVTSVKDEAHAVLVRALEPLENEQWMLARRNKEKTLPALTAGPGALSQALGIHCDYTGTQLWKPDSPIRIEDWGFKINPADIASGPRIGVEYAGDCAAWPWRFWLIGSPWVSKGSGLKKQQ